MPLDAAARRRILEKLVEAESFERFLHAKYVGHKRFSLEGCEAAIPLLDRVLSDAARAGVREAVIGMAHRGRLNVLANTVGKPLAQIFSEFEGDVDPQTRPGLRRREVPPRRHRRARVRHRRERWPSRWRPTRATSNGSIPVVEGMVRAKQDAIARRAARAASCPSSSTATPPSPGRGSWRRR